MYAIISQDMRGGTTVELGVKGMGFYSSIPFTTLLVSVFN